MMKTEMPAELYALSTNTPHTPQTTHTHTSPHSLHMTQPLHLQTLATSSQALLDLSHTHTPPHTPPMSRISYTRLVPLTKHPLYTQMYAHSLDTIHMTPTTHLSPLHCVLSPPQKTTRISPVFSIVTIKCNRTYQEPSL